MNVYRFTIWYETTNGVDTYDEIVVAEDSDKARGKLEAEQSKLARLGLGRFEIGHCNRLYKDVIA